MGRMRRNGLPRLDLAQEGSSREAARQIALDPRTHPNDLLALLSALSEQALERKFASRHEFVIELVGLVCCNPSWPIDRDLFEFDITSVQKAWRRGSLMLMSNSAMTMWAMGAMAPNVYTVTELVRATSEYIAEYGKRGSYDLVWQDWMGGKAGRTETEEPIQMALGCAAGRVILSKGSLRTADAMAPMYWKMIEYTVATYCDGEEDDVPPSRFNDWVSAMEKDMKGFVL